MLQKVRNLSPVTALVKRIYFNRYHIPFDCENYCPHVIMIPIDISLNTTALNISLC